MRATLWHLELSHYSEKVRWALDHKAVPHVRRTPMPGLHGPVAMALTRSRHRRLPVVRLDAETIADSSAIIAALEQRVPEPALYPADPQERARALALEDDFDEQLAPATRAFSWNHILAEGKSIAAAVAPGSTGARRRLFDTMTPVVAPFVRSDYRATAAAADDARVAILAAAERVEREVGPSGYLVGDRFSVADLAGAALFTPLLCPPQRPYAPVVTSPAILELRAELEARAAGRWVAEMYARHRGVSAEVPA
ncbi:MAG: glutathione S-transferase [Solirubrobacteraceae bacterium]|nr:glutathione S-transferase [Solirubrobacteraceae bacterium]